MPANSRWDLTRVLKGQGNIATFFGFQKPSSGFDLKIVYIIYNALECICLYMCTDPSSNVGGWVWGYQGVFEKTTSNQILMGKIGLRESGQEWFPPSPQMQASVFYIFIHLGYVSPCIIVYSNKSTNRTGHDQQHCYHHVPTVNQRRLLQLISS